jgi:cysteine desulfurase / selenocysteine lyase
MSLLNVEQIRNDFPILEREARKGVRVIYLDSTATSQKPVQVIEAMNDYYRRSNANIHRGVHTLAEEATTMYEGARERIAKFVNAAHSREVIYTRNTTESINLVAYSWARANLKAGDLVILTEMEHHSNLVPWHMLQMERGIELEFIPVTEDGLAGSGCVQNASGPPPEAGLVYTHVQCPRHDQPSRGDHPFGA